MSGSQKLQRPILGGLSNMFSSLFFWGNEPTISDLVQTSSEALTELERRRKDPVLQQKIEEYLQGDIPDYFREGPILYLARHIVTPNFETLRFIHLTSQLGLKTVVSQDSKGLFVSQNHVKRALGKLPVCRRMIQKGDTLNEQYQNVTIINFNTADGKPFADIRTLWGERLIEFHTRLFSRLGLQKIDMPDDAAWIDRHRRDNLLEHYKQLLALFVVHGIFFENYNLQNAQEELFVRTILRPACDFIEERFGHRPLIVPVFPDSFESNLFWISYPHEVLTAVRESNANIQRMDMGGIMRA